MAERVCLVHYHEIGLKGRNRVSFERRLQDNLTAALVGFPVGRVELLASRLAVRVVDEQLLGEVAQRIGSVPGVQNVSLAYRINREPALMESTALSALLQAGTVASFRVESRRTNTDFEESSLDMNRRIGGYLQAHTGLPVDLAEPDATVGVLVSQGSCFVWSARVPGVGGLPVGSGGKVLTLLSAGIDSPVAAWRMMRRGAVVVGVHFSGRPAVSDTSDRLVSEIGEHLEQAGGLGRIYTVAFGEIQRHVALSVPPDLRVIMYRRLMIAVSEAIAGVERAKALVTGESLGQVASQTLDNMAAIDEAATLPVLRPLVGSDKLEIIRDAKALGTYRISTTDHTDCCTLFMPRTPETHAKLSKVLEATALLDRADLVRQALESLEWRDYRCPSYRPPACWPAAAGESVQGGAHAASSTGAPGNMVDPT